MKFFAKDGHPYESGPGKGGNVDGTRLARYVAGACSAQEKEAVERWTAEDESHAALLSELQQAWALAERSMQEKNVEAALARLHEKMRAEERASARTRSAADRRARRPRRRSTGSFLLRTTAVVVLITVTAVLLLAFGLLDLTTPLTGGGASQQIRIYRTEKGQRALITLPDGSVVHLNVGSTLAVSAKYAEKRVVRLEGEAYFDVARDDGRPFLIRTARATVRVLGTAFDVRAYAHEPAAQVVVAEGRVAVHPKPAPQNSTPDVDLQADVQQPATSDTLTSADHAVVLRPYQLAVVSKGGLLTTHHRVNLDPYLAWTEGRLVFEDASFEEVVTELERWYDLKIDVPFPYDAVRPFNGTFDDESLDEVLTIIATSLNLTCERDGRHVTFSRTGAAAEFRHSEASSTSPVQITR